MTGLRDVIKSVTFPQLNDSKELSLQASGYLRGAQTLPTHKKHFTVSPTKKAFLAPAACRPSILPHCRGGSWTGAAFNRARFPNKSQTFGREIAKAACRLDVTFNTYTTQSSYCLGFTGSPEGSPRCTGSGRACTAPAFRNVNSWMVLDGGLIPGLPPHGRQPLAEHKGQYHTEKLLLWTRHNQLPPGIAATALLKCIKQPEAKTPINSSVKAEMFFSNGSPNTNNHSSLMCT